MDSSSFSPALIAPGDETLIEGLHQNPFLRLQRRSSGR